MKKCQNYENCGGYAQKDDYLCKECRNRENAVWNQLDKHLQNSVTWQKREKGKEKDKKDGK